MRRNKSRKSQLERFFDEDDDNYPYLGFPKPKAA